MDSVQQESVKAGIITSQTWVDYPDNKSIATILYIYKCNHNCLGCHNPDLQHECTEPICIVNPTTAAIQIIDSMRNNMSNKVVLSGGDPLHPDNVKFTNILLDILRVCGAKTCIYTGYSIDYVQQHVHKPFRFVKCGKYLVEQKQSPIKTDKCLILSSQNQCIYNNNYEKITKDGILYFDNAKSRSIQCSKIYSLKVPVPQEQSEI